jgi:hypothetical protein
MGWQVIDAHFDSLTSSCSDEMRDGISDIFFSFYVLLAAFSLLHPHYKYATAALLCAGDSC